MFFNACVAYPFAMSAP